MSAKHSNTNDIYNTGNGCAVWSNVKTQTMLTGFMSRIVPHSSRIHSKVVLLAVDGQISITMDTHIRFGYVHLCRNERSLGSRALQLAVCFCMVGECCRFCLHLRERAENSPVINRSINSMYVLASFGLKSLADGDFQIIVIRFFLLWFQLLIKSQIN